MTIYILTTGDATSEKLKTYCEDISKKLKEDPEQPTEVGKKVIDAASDEGKAFASAHGVTAPVVVITDEDGKDVLKTVDMDELVKFFG